MEHVHVDVQGTWLRCGLLDVDLSFLALYFQFLLHSAPLGETKSERGTLSRVHTEYANANAAAVIWQLYEHAITCAVAASVIHDRLHARPSRGAGRAAACTTVLASWHGRRGRVSRGSWPRSCQRMALS